MEKVLNPSRRGFMVMDVVGGLILVSILAGVLAVAMNQQNRAEQKLADSRAAVRIAERTLAELHLSANTPNADDETRIAVRPVQEAKGIGDLVWVEVQVAYRGEHAELVGLIPRKNLPAEGRAP